jgi:hypothetical protein
MRRKKVIGGMGEWKIDGWIDGAVWASRFCGCFDVA